MGCGVQKRLFYPLVWLGEAEDLSLAIGAMQAGIGDLRCTHRQRAITRLDKSQDSSCLLVQPAVLTPHLDCARLHAAATLPKKILTVYGRPRRMVVEYILCDGLQKAPGLGTQ